MCNPNPNPNPNPDPDPDPNPNPNPNPNQAMIEPLLPGGSYHYLGSLTTPPCTPGVSWYVLRRKAAVCQRQVERLSAVLAVLQARNPEPQHQPTPHPKPTPQPQPQPQLQPHPQPEPEPQPHP